MNTILVATDFSDNALAAAEYAVLFAKEIKARIILFHSFSILFPVPNISKEITDKDEYGKAVNVELEKLVISLGHTAPGVQIDSICKVGFPVESIAEIVKEKNIDLVIMGIKGAGILNEIFVGSFTTDIIIQALFPVLVVPLKAKFKPIKNIVLACDCHEIHNYDSLHLLKEISGYFNSRIETLHIKKEEEKINEIEKEAVRCRLEEHFSKFEFSFHEANADDFTYALNEFIDKTRAEMVVMLPGKHSFFESIFFGSHTKKLAFHTHVPLLALPEKNY